MSETFTRREVLGAAGAVPLRGLRLERGQPSTGAAQQRREELYGLLGDLPPRDRPTGGRKLTEESRGGYLLERWERENVERLSVGPSGEALYHLTPRQQP